MGKIIVMIESSRRFSFVGINVIIPTIKRYCVKLKLICLIYFDLHTFPILIYNNVGIWNGLLLNRTEQY